MNDHYAVCDICGKATGHDDCFTEIIDGEELCICYECCLNIRGGVSTPTTTQLIMEATESVAAMLTDKNRAYGNSALNQLGIFNKSSITTSLTSRVDDKLARIKNSECLARDDVFDLVGYLILVLIDNGWVGYNGEEKL